MAGKKVDAYGGMGVARKHATKYEKEQAKNKKKPAKKNAPAKKAKAPAHETKYQKEQRLKGPAKKNAPAKKAKAPAHETKYQKEQRLKGPAKKNAPAKKKAAAKSAAPKGWKKVAASTAKNAAKGAARWVPGLGWIMLLSSIASGVGKTPKPYAGKEGQARLAKDKAVLAKHAAAVAKKRPAKKKPNDDMGKVRTTPRPDRKKPTKKRLTLLEKDMNKWRRASESKKVRAGLKSKAKAGKNAYHLSPTQKTTKLKLKAKKSDMYRGKLSAKPKSKAGKAAMYKGKLSAKRPLSAKAKGAAYAKYNREQSAKHRSGGR